MSGAAPAPGGCPVVGTARFAGPRTSECPDRIQRQVVPYRRRDKGRSRRSCLAVRTRCPPSRRAAGTAAVGTRIGTGWLLSVRRSADSRDVRALDESGGMRNDSVVPWRWPPVCVFRASRRRTSALFDSWTSSERTDRHGTTESLRRIGQGRAGGDLQSLTECLRGVQDGSRKAAAAAGNSSTKSTV